MHYYHVWPRSAQYHGQEALTYQSDKALPTGSLVSVPLQKQEVLGVIVGKTAAPRFATKLLSQVYDLPPLPRHLLSLGSWLAKYYPAPLGQIAQQLVPASLDEKTPAEAFAALPAADLSHLPPLTEEQETALEAMTRADTYLLHGKTGSGKTRIYMELAARTVENGKSAIILTPEISLISQLAKQFAAVFSERVVIFHSQLTSVERRQAWLKSLRTKQPLVVIGPRSALFSPLAKVGLIVLDEAHEAAYKQEQAPHYQTGRVAAYLAQLQRAHLVLGSATPSVSDYYLAEQKHKPIVVLTKPAQPAKPPVVTMVDLKDRSLFNRSPHLSDALIKQLEAALGRQEQGLLYLNRRGSARLILCENCGWQALCPHCDLPLTYHADRHELRCHACNHHEAVPSACPNCGFPSILFKTVGTKAIVEEVQRLLPNARVQRFDTDNLKAERFEHHYPAVHAGEVDILVGTQMIAKGLDLPRLSTLGVVIADTSLQLPDFSAQERTYQLLTQVLGRISRGHIEGHAVIQTYNPEQPVLQAVITGDWDNFYHEELQERKTYRFPPFYYLLKLTCRRASSEQAEAAAQKFKTEIQAAYRVIVEGPAPAFHEKMQNKHQWQLVVKATQRAELLKIIDNLPTSSWSYDIDATDLL